MRSSGGVRMYTGYDAWGRVRNRKRGSQNSKVVVS